MESSEIAERPGDSSGSGRDPAGWGRNAARADYPSAVLVAGRPYPRDIIVPALAGSGLLVTEIAPRAHLASAFASLQPDLVILPAYPSDDALRTIIEVTGLTRAICVALIDLPNAAFAARALVAGADLVVRDSDGETLLEAQMIALARRTNAPEPASTARRILIDDLVVDLDRRSVSGHGLDIRLTAAEFAILTTLALNAGRVVSPSELVRLVLGTVQSEPESRGFAKVHIARIRRKLEAAGLPPGLIRNVRAAGYICDTIAR